MSIDLGLNLIFKYKQLVSFSSAISICAVSFSVFSCGGGGVSYFDPNAPFDPNAIPSPPALVYGDVPQRTRSWQFDALNYDKVKELGLTGNGVLVAVVDTGIDVDHPYLGHLVHKDSIRVLDGVFYPNYQDYEGHGTAMASLIAGGDYSSGHLLGIAPEAELLVVAANDMYGSPSTFTNSDLGKAIRYATDKGAQVISFSIGSPNGSRWDDDVLAMSYATRNDVIVVMATGNEGYYSATNSPAEFAGSSIYNDLGLAVYALDESGDLASFSSTCRDVKDPTFCIGAPGEDLLEADLNPYSASGDLTYGSGTSQATAIVAGSTALLIERFPELEPYEVVEILYLTADDLGDSGVDQIYGSGALNLERALMPYGNTRLANNVEISSDDVIVQNSSAMGASLATSKALKNVSLYDQYDRKYGLDLTKAIQSNQSELALDKNEFDTHVLLQYEGIITGFVDYLGIEYGDLAHDQNPDSALYYSDSTANANPYSENLDLEFGIGQKTGALPYDLRFATNAESGGDEMVAQIHGYHNLGVWKFGLGASYHSAKGKVLGTQFPDAVASIDQTNTTALHMSGEYKNGQFSAFFRGSFGLSDVEMKQNNGLFTSFKDMKTSSFAAGLAFRDLATIGDQIDFAVSQSLRLENGVANGNAVALSAQQVNLVPDGREISFELGYRAPITESLDIGAGIVYQIEPGHDARASAQTGASLRLSYSF